MKTRHFLFTVLLAFASVVHASAQKHDFADWQRYAADNAALGAPVKGVCRVVMMGNSITEGWAKMRPAFFKKHHLIGRGISGQTTYQFLLRFREDVIRLKPNIVVINGGTNDIAENTGAYDEDLTFGNIITMAELARYHGIKVILTSCLPAAGFKWRPAITDAMHKIKRLNTRIKAYAKANNIIYVDYFKPLLSPDGKGMNPAYGKDTPAVHPNDAGYAIMEKLLEKYL